MEDFDKLSKLWGVGIAQFNLATVDGNTPEVRPLISIKFWFFLSVVLKSFIKLWAILKI